MRERTIEKHIRLNEIENRKLNDLSNLSGLSKSDVFRSLLDSAVIKELPSKDFYNAINEIHKIGVNINQLTRIANSTGNIYEQELNNNFKKLNTILEKIKDKYL